VRLRADGRPGGGPVNGGPVDPALDALRACCAAAWSLIDAGGLPAGTRPSVEPADGPAREVLEKLSLA
jgi:hypothetical protein